MSTHLWKFLELRFICHDTYGAGVISLLNVTVGERSVIGVRAVVTKDVPPYSVVAGVPAKVIQRLLFEEVKFE